MKWLCRWGGILTIKKCVKEVRFEIGNEQNHTLICGCNGNGKSNFLHVLIQNLAFYYALDEVQLFLLDY